MDKFEDIKELLGKALKIIYENKEKFPLGYKNKITAEKLEQLAGNHLFDDRYKELGITKWEGHDIRAYFQTTAHTNGKEYVLRLHETFPDILDKEDPRFLEKINKQRIMEGFEPINL